MSKKEYKRLWRQNHSLVSKLLDATDTCVPTSAELPSLFDDETKCPDQEDINIGAFSVDSDDHVDGDCVYSSDHDDLLCVYSSDDDVLDQIVFDESESDEKHNFSTDLASWAVRNRCTQASINELLSILKSHGHPELPKDSRSLLKTPRHVVTSKKCGGDYVHFGIATGFGKPVLGISKSTFSF